MKLNIITEQSLWLLPLCMLLAAAYTLLMYRKSAEQMGIGKAKLYLLASLRFIFSLSLAFLLLGPVVRSLSKTIKKPIIVLAQDNSLSITLNKDSLFYRSDYPVQLAAWQKSIGKNYELVNYQFGQTVNRSDSAPQFTDRQTDLSLLFEELEGRFINMDLGAVVLATDGVFNKGFDPSYTAKRLGVPIHCIALGDTAIQKDAAIKQVKTNKIAFLGNNFPIQLSLSAQKLQGQKSTLTISNNQSIIYKKDLTFTNDDYFQTLEIPVDANKKGLQHYTITLSKTADESNLINNQHNLIVEVVDVKQKILILGSAPHPDIGALRSALEINPNFEVEVAMAKQFSKKIKGFNLVILHQLPSKTHQITQILSQLNESQTPSLFILGQQTSLNNLNNLQKGLQVQNAGKSFDESTPIYNTNFQLFTLDEEIRDFAKQLPPLSCPFGTYKTAPNAEILFNQRIKGIETGKPMLFFTKNNDTKTAFLMGEGIWRWNIYNYLQYQNHELFNQLINKLAQYLALSLKKDNLVINAQKLFNENEPVIIDAEVYNESFEPINNPDLSLTISNTNGKTYEYSFSRTNRAYSINCGTLPVGNYSYLAKVKLGNNEFTKSGHFAVQAVNSEALNTVANHQLLYRLSTQSHGLMVAPTQLQEIAKALEADPNIVAVSYSENSLRDLINEKWIFVLLVLLIGTEWFIRKHNGGY